MNPTICRIIRIVATAAVALALFVVPWARLHANAPVVLEVSAKRVALGPYLDVLEDSGRSLTIDDVLSPGKAGIFIENKAEVLNYGYTRSAFWIRFTVENRTGSTQERILEVDAPLIDDIEFYSTDAGGKYVKVQLGEISSRSAGDRMYPNPRVLIALDPGQTRTYYFRYYDEGSVTFPLLMWTQEAFANSSMTRYFVQGILYGIMAIMLLYNLILYIMVRDRGYLYYVLFIIAYFFFSFVKDGYAHLTLLDNLSPWWINRIYGVSVCFLCICCMQFCRSFINIRATSRLIDNIIVVIVVLFFMIMGLFFVVELITSGIFLMVLIPLFLLLLLFVAIFFPLYYHSRTASIYLISFIVFLVGGIIISLRFIDVFPSNIITENGMPLGLSISLMLLSLGLGDRINSEKKERIKAQEEALENEKLAREAQAEAMEYQLQVVEALRDADRMKDEFLANTSHELRTPLNGIIGIAESLMDGAAGAASDLMKDNLSMIAISGRRLENLINDILDFSRIKERGLVINRVLVDMRQVTEIVLTLLKPLADNKGLVMSNNIPPDLRPVSGDENRLQQIMNNLVGNAIKFTDRGEIKIDARLVGTDLIEVSVADSGIGIPPDKLVDVFNPFEQADASMSRSYGGTGLGLSITKSLVELHGGKIRAESDGSSGTTIIFTLPIAENVGAVDITETPAVRKNIPIAAAKVSNRGVLVRDADETTPHDSARWDGAMVPFLCLQGACVLVVDDDTVNLRVIKNMLGVAGVIVQPASSAAEAMKILDGGYRPDAAIVDVMMPVMNGLELCRLIRTRFSPTELPIIFLTAKNQVTDLVNAFLFGGNDYIVKPFLKNELLARLKTLIFLKNSYRDRESLVLMKNEMEIAKRIQESIIPSAVPTTEGIGLAARYHSYVEVGGDFFDLHVIDKNRVGIIVADVSGHGFAAALIAAMIKIAFTFSRDFAHDPAAVLKQIHNSTIDKLGGQFITAAYAIIDKKQMTMSCARAGHPPVLVWRKNENAIEEILPPGGMISTIGPLDWEVRTCDLSAGDKVIMYSDGVFELWNDAGIFYGEERVWRSIIDHGNKPAAQLADAILEDVARWTGRTGEFQDDATLIVAEML